MDERLLKLRLDREREARKQAEALLDQKSRELYEANLALEQRARQGTVEGSPPAADGQAGLSDVALLRRRLEREKKARKAAENLLETKSRELFESNLIIERQAHEARETAARLAVIMDSIVDGIVTTNLDGSILNSSAAVEQIFSSSREDLLERSILDLLDQGEEERYAILRSEVMEEAGRGGSGLAGDRVEAKYTLLTGTRGDGANFPMEMAISVVQKGDAPFLVHVLRDVTERENAQKNLLQARKIQAMGGMAGGISHELNNLLLPITTLVGMTLKQLPDNNPFKKRLEKVSEAAERAKTIVGQFVEFSREGAPVSEVLDASEVIRESISFVSSTVLSNVELVEKVDEEVGAIKGDPALIRVVMTNLVSNACDAVGGKVGRVEVSLTRDRVSLVQAREVQGLTPGLYAKLTVSDTGCGMDEETLGRIFDPFFTTKEVGEGTGLGLATVHGIVERHSGAIRALSKVGEGTSVEVYLPLVADGD